MWFMGMTLKQRCNHRSGWGKGLLDQNSTNESVKDQDVCCVFWMERHCPSWIYTTWSDGKQTVVPGSFSAFEGCCAQEEAWIVGKPDWMLHHDSALAHASLLIRSYLTNHQTSIVPQPRFSPDLVPADFFLFPKLKTTLKGRCFQTIDEIQEYAIIELRAITESAFREAFQQWKKCWEWCITSRRDCFEGDSA